VRLVAAAFLTLNSRSISRWIQSVEFHLSTIVKQVYAESPVICRQQSVPLLIVRIKQFFSLCSQTYRIAPLQRWMFVVSRKMRQLST